MYGYLTQKKIWIKGVSNRLLVRWLNLFFFIENLKETVVNRIPIVHISKHKINQKFIKAAKTSEIISRNRKQTTSKWLISKTEIFPNW